MRKGKNLRHKNIPKTLQSVLWSADVDKLDLERDKGYIIHQVLIYGTIEELKWLFNTYSKKDIIDVFLNVPYKNYPRQNFYFIKNFIINLKDASIDEDKYVTSIHGPVRPRATEDIQKT